jgi:hypothetical protein
MIMGEDQPDIDLDALRAVGDDPDLDELFGVLSDRQARLTLAYLSERPTVTLDDLADVVTGAEAAATDDVATPADRKRVRVRLYHVVLPKLVDAGYVEFDPDEERVTGANVPPRIDSLLEAED